MNFIHNRLFAQLSATDQAALQGIGTREQLSARQVIGAPGSSDRRVYFPTGASVALMVERPAGAGLALGLVGHEGAVGVQFALGLDPGIFTLKVQTPGAAWRVDGAELEMLALRRPDILISLSRYLWGMTQDIAIFAALAQLSEVKPRLARWILTSYSRTHLQELTLTQVHLAEMLGVRRASITLAAIELRSEGLVRYTRGKLVVVDAGGLEAVASSSDSTRRL